MAEPPRKPRAVTDAEDADAAKPDNARAQTTVKGERVAPPVGKVRNRKGAMVGEVSVYAAADDSSTVDEGLKNRRKSGNSSKVPTVENVSHRNPKLLNRQEKAFELSVIFGKTAAEIAVELDVSTSTVAADLRAELVLRSAESEELRDEEKVRQLMMVQRLINDARESRNKPGTGAYNSYAKGLEMRARLLGLDAPTKIELGVSQLLEAINVLPEREQERVFERIVSPVGIATEANAAHNNDEGIIEGEVVQSTSAEVIPLDAIVQEAPLEADGAEAIQSENITPSVSAAERDAAAREAVVRAAMGTTPGGYVIPRAHRGTVGPAAPVVSTAAPVSEMGDKGDILDKVKAHAEESREKARLRHAEALRVPDASANAERPTAIDPALPVLNDAAFYKLPPSEQAARVRAARAGTHTGSEP